jgi:integrase
MGHRWRDVDLAAGRTLLSITSNGKPRFAYLTQLSRQVIDSLKGQEHRLGWGFVPCKIPRVPFSMVTFLRTSQQ